MIEPDRLAGRWVHSHEEDTEDEMVFRAAGAGFTFPPARGRTSFELRTDGSYVETAPGPADRPEDRPGSWELEEGRRLVMAARPGAPARVLEITAAEGDVLRVRK
ncbi:MAG: hypothetical protein LC713_04990 [Actinobacteria bacterium]|nr:hypothetical protein [Actinomycetota bacterium]